MLGGSAVHFALAASFFTEVGVVGPVGDDFGDEQLAVLDERGIDTDDIERVDGGKTFFWRGHYDHDMNVAHTDDTQLNVFADFEPKLSRRSLRGRDALPRQHPARPPARRPRASRRRGFAALDSMNLWIETARDSLRRRDRRGRLRAAQRRRAADADRAAEPGHGGAGRRWSWGRRVVVAKRGEYGAALFTDEGPFAIPGLPLEDVRDPTGAGDSFAGGFLGYLDAVRVAGEHDERGAAPGDGLRLGDGLVQRRGLRHRARRAPRPRPRSPSASPTFKAPHALRAEPSSLEAPSAQSWIDCENAREQRTDRGEPMASEQETS